MFLTLENKINRWYRSRKILHDIKMINNCFDGNVCIILSEDDFSIIKHRLNEVVVLDNPMTNYMGYELTPVFKQGETVPELFKVKIYL
jgi:hypothetical protein